MKKHITIFVLFFALLLSAYSEVTNPVSRPFYIQGAYGEVIDVSITPLSTQSASFYMGMPFDIESPLVQYRVMKDGRAIAQWSMVANSKFNLIIKADLLTSKETIDGTENGAHAELSYILTFDYEFGYYAKDDGHLHTYSGQLRVNNDPVTGGGNYFNNISGKDETIELKDGSCSFAFGSDNLGDGILGTQNGYISFMFTQNSTNLIADGTQVPSGDYSALVTVTVEGRQ